MRILNTNSHRIYADGGAKRVDSGRTFEGSEADLERDGLIDADSSEGQAWLAAHAPAGEAGHTVALDSTQTVSDVSLLGRSLATARLRDRLDPATETTVKGTGEGRLNNQPSVGGPAEVVPTEHVTDPNLPPPAPAGGDAGAVVSTGAPGHDAIADERSHTAPAVLARLGDQELASAEAERAAEGADVGEPGTAGDGPTVAEELGAEPPADTPASSSGAPSYAEGVDFTSASAENKADEYVAAGKLDASSLKPGKGNGSGGAYTVKDVEAAAK